MLPIIFKSTFFIAVFMGIFGVTIFLYGEQLVVLAYGAKYAGTGLIVAILIMGVCANSLVIPINCALYAMDRPDVGFKARLLGLVVALTFGLWMVRSFGVTGVAAGLLIVHLAASLYEATTFLLLMHYKRPFSSG